MRRQGVALDDGRIFDGQLTVNLSDGEQSSGYSTPARKRHTVLRVSAGIE
jgi:hypothetical protein